jgi:hypothetical protein
MDGGILQAVTNSRIFIFLSLISFRGKYGQLLAPGSVSQTQQLAISTNAQTELSSCVPAK